MRKMLFIIVFLLLIVIGATYAFFNKKPSGTNTVGSAVKPAVSPFNTPFKTVIAKGLDTPWALVFLPDKSILFTERPGRVRLVTSQGRLESKPIAILAQVKEIGEGGLLGIAVDPKFTTNKLVYLYYTYAGNQGETLNRVSTFTYQNKTLVHETVIIDRIPGSGNHNGGRIKFGPDSFLYVTTGDAENPSRSQDRNSLAGKILRVTTDGKPAPGNPFGTRVYSYGHRNPQGLAWDSGGNLWATEHGRSGVPSGLDEINQIRPGENYGWPTIQGGQSRNGMVTPILHSGSETWAPAGAAIIGESMYFGGLRGEALYKIPLPNPQRVTEYFKNELGRIRDVVQDENGMLYITTSNNDGRGSPNEGDDIILKVDPRQLN